MGNWYLFLRLLLLNVPIFIEHHDKDKSPTEEFNDVGTLSPEYH